MQWNGCYLFSLLVAETGRVTGFYLLQGKRQFALWLKVRPLVSELPQEEFWPTGTGCVIVVKWLTLSESQLRVCKLGRWRYPPRRVVRTEADDAKKALLLKAVLPFEQEGWWTFLVADPGCAGCSWYLCCLIIIVCVFSSFPLCGLVRCSRPSPLLTSGQGFDLFAQPSVSWCSLWGRGAPTPCSGLALYVFS